MKQLESTNDNRSMMKGTYQDTKLDKSNELNETMSIQEQAPDEYEKKLHNLGGQRNG